MKKKINNIDLIKINWEKIVAGFSLIVAVLTYYSANLQFKKNYELTLRTLEEDNIQDSLRQIRDEAKFYLTIEQSRSQFEKNLQLLDKELILANDQRDLYAKELEIQNIRLEKEEIITEMELKKDKLILDSKIRFWVSKISVINIRQNSEFSKLDIEERTALFKEMEDFIVEEIGNKTLINNDNLHRKWLEFYFYLLSPTRQGNQMLARQFSKLEDKNNPQGVNLQKNESFKPNLNNQFNQSLLNLKLDAEDRLNSVLSVILENFLQLLGETCSCENLEYVVPREDSIMFMPLLKKNK